jgi:Uma2 family endonuclease
MTLAVEPKPKRWSKAEYHSLLEWVGEDRLRYELIDGEIIQMPPQTDEHAHDLMLADYGLRKVFRRGFLIRIQSPLELTASSEPEPDLLVTKGELREQRKHPKTAELIIEIAWGSLVYDRETKGSLYASRGIRDYWIVNLHESVVEVYRRPMRDAAARFGYSYQDIKFLHSRETVTPLAAPRTKVKVADLLP